MAGRKAHSRIDGIPGRSALIDEDDISRLLANLLLRLAAVALAVTLAAIGHGVSSTDGVEATKTLPQAQRVNAER